MRQFRLSPGLTGGDWHHDPVTKAATINLRFAGIPHAVELRLIGDLPNLLAGKHGPVFGYRALPIEQQANEAGEPTEAVAAFVDDLKANSVGVLTKVDTDDADGVELAWRNERFECVGVVRFCVRNPRQA